MTSWSSSSLSSISEEIADDANATFETFLKQSVTSNDVAAVSTNVTMSKAGNTNNITIHSDVTTSVDRNHGNDNAGSQNASGDVSIQKQYIAEGKNAAIDDVKNNATDDELKPSNNRWDYDIHSSAGMTQGHDRNDDATNNDVKEDNRNALTSSLSSSVSSLTSIPDGEELVEIPQDDIDSDELKTSDNTNLVQSGPVGIKPIQDGNLKLDTGNQNENIEGDETTSAVFTDVARLESAAKEVKTSPKHSQTSSLSSSVSSLTSIPDGEDFVETPQEDIDSDEAKTSDNTELVKDKSDQDESGKPINKRADVEANTTTETGIAVIEAKKSEPKEVKTFPQPPQTSSLSSSVSSLTSIPDGEDFVETPHEDIDSDESKTSDNTELVKDKFDQDESGKPINKPANVEANITTEPGIADVEAKKSEPKAKVSPLPFRTSSLSSSVSSLTSIPDGEDFVEIPQKNIDSDESKTSENTKLVKNISDQDESVKPNDVRAEDDDIIKAMFGVRKMNDVSDEASSKTQRMENEDKNKGSSSSSLTSSISSPDGKETDKQSEPNFIAESKGSTAKEVKTSPKLPQASSLSSSVSSLTSIPDGEDFVETPQEDIDSDEAKTSDNTELVKDKSDQDERLKLMNKPADVEANTTTETGIVDVEAKKSEPEEVKHSRTSSLSSSMSSLTSIPDADEFVEIPQEDIDSNEAETSDSTKVEDHEVDTKSDQAQQPIAKEVKTSPKHSQTTLLSSTVSSLTSIPDGEEFVEFPPEDIDSNELKTSNNAKILEDKSDPAEIKSNQDESLRPTEVTTSSANDVSTNIATFDNIQVSLGAVKTNDVSNNDISKTQTNSSVENEKNEDNEPSFLQGFVTETSFSSLTPTSSNPDEKNADIKSDKKTEMHYTKEAAAKEASSLSSSVSSLTSIPAEEEFVETLQEEVDANEPKTSDNTKFAEDIVGTVNATSGQYVNVTSSSASLSSFFEDDKHNTKQHDEGASYKQTESQTKTPDENIISDSVKKNVEPVVTAPSTSSKHSSSPSSDADVRKDVANRKKGKQQNEENKSDDKKILPKQDKTDGGAKQTRDSRKAKMFSSKSSTKKTEVRLKPIQPSPTPVKTGKNDNFKRTGQESQSSSSDVSSDSTSDITSSSSSENEERGNSPLPPNVKPSKLAMRPKSAKPSRTTPTQPVSTKTPLPISEKRKHPPARTVSTSTSSSSAMVSAESDAADRHRAEAKTLDQLAREQFLHRCLDEYLATQLDKQRAYFQQGFDSPQRRRRSKLNKSTTTSPKVSRKRWEPRSRSEIHGSSDAILPSFSPRVREEDIQRNIQRLVSELARHENLRSLMNQTNDVSASGKDNKHKKKFVRRDSGSDQSSSSESSGTLPYTSETKTYKSGEAPQSLHRGILKKGKAANKKKKHVRMVDVRDDVVAYPRAPRKSRRRVLSGKPPHPRLVALLNAIGPTDYIMADGYGQLHRVTLKHTPVRPRVTPNRTRNQWKQKKKKSSRKTEPLAPSDDDKKENETYPSAIINKHNRPQTAKQRTGGDEDKVETAVGHSPRIRPGTGPIKCNWNPEKSQTKTFEPKFSDHQLKNSDNPAVLEWLANKNVLARQTRIRKTREHRTKRDQLMQEQNDRDDHRANALIEYDKWKKRKNREVLLRRRNETLESKGGKSETEMLTAEQQRRNILKPKDSSITTFSDLRSSASTPYPPQQSPRGALVTTGARRRPKSAPTKVSFGVPKSSSPSSQNFVPVQIDFANGDVTILSPQNDVTNHSAREPMTQEKSNSNFMRDLLEEKPHSMFDIPPPGTFPKKKTLRNPDGGKRKKQPAPEFEMEHYNNWVRSKGTSSPYQVKYKKKKEKERSPPPHDPLSNEMISDLARRRIKKILDQKKRVDSGLRKKQLPDEDSNPAPNDESSLKKWRLKEEPGVNLNLANMAQKRKRPGTAKARTVAASSLTSISDRPVFSYNKKTKSKSIFHERNPVINQALNS